MANQASFSNQFGSKHSTTPTHSFSSLFGGSVKQSSQPPLPPPLPLPPPHPLSSQTPLSSSTTPSFSSLFGGSVKNVPSQPPTISISSSSSSSSPPPPRPTPLSQSHHQKPIITSQPPLQKVIQKNPAFARGGWGGGTERVEEFSGLSIIDRCIPSIQVRVALEGRTVHKISDFEKGDQRQFAAPGGDSKKHVPWATIGVLTEKSFPKSSHGGSDGRPGGGNYQIWTLSDYSAQISLFLFAEAYAGLVNEPIGSIFLISSPSLIPAVERRSFSLSASKDGQVVRLGTSPDFGVCKGTRKDGKPCTMVVNATKCQYCKYHIQDVYRKSMQAQGVFTMSMSGAIIDGVGGRNISQGRYSGRSADQISSLAEKSSTLLQGVSSLGPKKGSNPLLISSFNAIQSLRVGKDGSVVTFTDLPIDDRKGKKSQTTASGTIEPTLENPYLTDEKARKSISSTISSVNANSNGGRSSRFGIRQVAALLGPSMENPEKSALNSTLPSKRKRDYCETLGFGEDDDLPETLRFSAIKSAKASPLSTSATNNAFITLSDSEEEEEEEDQKGKNDGSLLPKAEVKSLKVFAEPLADVKSNIPLVSTTFQPTLKVQRGPLAKTLHVASSQPLSFSPEEINRQQRLLATEKLKEKLKSTRQEAVSLHTTSSRQEPIDSRKVLPKPSSTFIPKKVQTAAGVSAALENAQALINKSSRHADEGADTALNQVLSRMDDRARLEAMQDVMSQNTSRKVTRYVCVDCEQAFDKRPVMCYSENHTVHTKEKTVWAFKCKDCSYHISYDFAVCAIPCPKCGVGASWEATCIQRFKEKTLDPGLVTKLQPRGEEHINSLRYG
jgi:hypothetical protein